MDNISHDILAEILEYLPRGDILNLLLTSQTMVNKINYICIQKMKYCNPAHIYLKCFLGEKCHCTSINSNGGTRCELCSSICCDKCKTLCDICLLKTCQQCSLNLCNCSCGNRLCGGCTLPCHRCNKIICDRCNVPCKHCKYVFCKSCQLVCDECNHLNCKSCSIYIENGNKVLCKY